MTQTRGENVSFADAMSWVEPNEGDVTIDLPCDPCSGDGERLTDSVYTGALSL